MQWSKCYLGCRMNFRRSSSGVELKMLCTLVLKNVLTDRQLVTVLGALENYISQWEDSDQTFVLTTLNKQHDKLAGVFHRFVEEQVRAIEDMKVTAKKRQGVLLMFRIFPVPFSS